MSLNPLLMDAPSLDEAIDRQPLVVAPETLVVEAIARMSQMRGVTCSLPNPDASADVPNILQGARASCVLVMRDQELLGIFTERDIVKLTAEQADFTGMQISEVMVHPVITLSESGFQDIFAALFLFRRYRIRHLVIVNERNHVVGVVSPESIRRVLRPTNLLKLRRVSEVMAAQVIHAEPTASVLHLAQLMASHRVSCVVIAETDTWENVLSAINPVGIVTERDIVQFQSLGLNLETTSAQVVMSTPLFLLSPEDSLWTAHQEMQRRRVQRLVVSWDWRAKLGIVTQTSLLRIFDPVEMYGVVETLQRTVAQLEAEKRLSTAFQTAVDAPLSQAIPESMVMPAPNLDRWLAATQACLQYLVETPELPEDVRDRSLKEAIADLQNIRHLVNKSIVRSEE